MYDFPVLDGTQGQNGGPYYFSSIVRQWKWPSLSREIGEIHKSSCHGNMTSQFSSLYSALIKCLDVWTNSLKQYKKKHTKNSEENIHVDTGA